MESIAEPTAKEDDTTQLVPLKGADPAQSITEPTAQEDAVDKLIARLAGEEQVVDKFGLVVDSLTTLYFRKPSSCGEITRSERLGKAWVVNMLAIKEGKTQPPLPIWKEVLTGNHIDGAGLAFAWLLSYWSAEPTPISELQALRLLRNPGLAKC